MTRTIHVISTIQVSSDDARLIDDEHLRELPSICAWWKPRAGELLSGHLKIEMLETRIVDSAASAAGKER